MFKRGIWVLVLLILINLIFVSWVLAKREVRSELLKTEGVYVINVVTGSPAAKAGLNPGDIILTINNQPVSVENIKTLVLSGTLSGNNPNIVMSVLRNGKIFNVSTHVHPENPNLGVVVRAPQEIKRVSSDSYSGQRLIEKANKEVEVSEKDSLSTKVSSINVLDAVFIDKNTGEITFVGHYDDRYKTGPLPYFQILDEALKYPYPSFSLDPTPNTERALKEIKNIFDKEISRVSRDPSYGTNWLSSIFKEILYSDNQLPEKQILLARLKKFSITPEEFNAYLRWDPKSKNWRFDSKEQLEMYFNLQSFFIKVFKALGFEGKYGQAVVEWWGFQKFAEAYGMENAGHWFRQVYETMGLIEDFEKIRTLFNTGQIDNWEATRRLLFLFYVNLFKGIGVDEHTINDLLRRAPKTGKIDLELSEFANKRVEKIQSEFLIDFLINNLVLSDTFLKKRFRLPAIEVKPTYYNLPSDTYMAKIFFYADYTLKYLTTINPETATLKDFDPFVAYLSKKAEEKGKGKEFQMMQSGFDRYWLFPGRVELKVSQDKSAIYFGKSEVKIGSESLSSGMPSWYNEILKEYSQTLTERYEEFAQIFPSLHTMREVQKIIALARWIHVNGLKVTLPHYQKVELESLDGVTGTTVAAFYSSKTRDTFSFFVENHGGGIDYTEKSNAWIQGKYIETKDALHQLAASSALAEKAVASALAGDLEAARALAEKSAQAMVGHIDLGSLGIKIPPTVSPKLSSLPVGSQGVFTQKTLEVVGANLDEYVKLKKDLKVAEGYKDVDPEKYQQILTEAKVKEAKIKESLQKLNELLNSYRNNPLDYKRIEQELVQLNPKKPSFIDVAALKPKPEDLKPKTEKDKQIKKERLLPDERKLREELADLRHKLELAKTNLDQLTKIIMENTKEFERWREKTERAISSSEARFKEVMLDMIQENIFENIKYEFSKYPNRVKEIEKFQQLLDTKDFTDWASMDPKTWEDIAEGLVKAVNALPGIGDYTKKLTKTLYHLVNTGYDVTTIFIHWKKMKEFEKNLDLYFKAVATQKEYMAKTIKRIKEIEEELEKLAKAKENPQL